MRILFFGGDDVSVATLRKLTQKLMTSSTSSSSLSVICPPGANPVRRFCSSTSSSLLQFCVSPEHPHTLRGFELSSSSSEEKMSYDLGIVVSFRYFLPPRVISWCKYVINAHPSLLPKYRGASPIHHTLLRGETIGGTSIIKIEPKVGCDCGDILTQRTLPIGIDETYEEYFPRVVELTADAMCDVVLPGMAHVEHLWHHAARRQDRLDVPKDKDEFWAPLFDKRTLSRLDFNAMTGCEVYNCFRTFCHERHRVHASLDVTKTPVFAKRRRSRTDLHRHPGKTIGVTFNELVPRHKWSVELEHELSLVKGCPGAVYFPKCCLRNKKTKKHLNNDTNNISSSSYACVACRGGESWAVFTSLTLEKGKPQVPHSFAAGYEMAHGVP
eukprot:PhM_4_TR4322/c0_g1_i1/m.35229/K00604/MTFMT, fmt; methionyl-tRNA formyltransferase